MLNAAVRKLLWCKLSTLPCWFTCWHLACLHPVNSFAAMQQQIVGIRSGEMNIEHSLVLSLSSAEVAWFYPWFHLSQNIPACLSDDFQAFTKREWQRLTWRKFGVYRSTHCWIQCLQNQRVVQEITPHVLLHVALQGIPWCTLISSCLYAILLCQSLDLPCYLHLDSRQHHAPVVGGQCFYHSFPDESFSAWPSGSSASTNKCLLKQNASTSFQPSNLPFAESKESLAFHAVGQNDPHSRSVFVDFPCSALRHNSCLRCLCRGGLLFPSLPGAQQLTIQTEVHLKKYQICLWMFVEWNEGRWQARWSRQNLSLCQARQTFQNASSLKISWNHCLATQEN